MSFSIDILYYELLLPPLHNALDPKIIILLATDFLISAFERVIMPVNCLPHTMFFTDVLAIENTFGLLHEVLSARNGKTAPVL